MTTNIKPVVAKCLPLLVLVPYAYAAPAHAEPGSSIHRLPSDDAAGPEFPIPTWAGVLIFFVLPIAIVLIRAAILSRTAGVTRP